MNKTQMLRRLNKLMATNQQELDGVTWYANAGRLVEELAERYQTPKATVAGILAVTSPRIHWKRNVQVTHEILAGVTPTGLFRANTDKAFAIRNGATPDSVLSGPKVRAFYSAIMGDTNAVVIDVWMLRALGWTKKVTQKAYDIMASVIRDCAKACAMLPSHFQAMVWVAVRGRAA